MEAVGRAQQHNGLLSRLLGRQHVREGLAQVQPHLRCYIWRKIQPLALPFASSLENSSCRSCSHNTALHCLACMTCKVCASVKGSTAPECTAAASSCQHGADADLSSKAFGGVPYGERVPTSPHANSSRLVLPTQMAPAGSWGCSCGSWHGTASVCAHRESGPWTACLLHRGWPSGKDLAA